jgi:dethiobiotin synthetase
MTSYVVAGAGTDIGKTYVSCALLRRWRAEGRTCAPLKPVLSGYDEANLFDSDAAHLLAANGETPSREAIAAISPWRFAAPLAPPQAAKLEGRELDFAAIVEFCRSRIRAAPSHTTHLIETAGGVMSPLTHDHTMLDLIAELGAPVIFVTGDYLGAVSHTLTALEALRARNQSVALLIINESTNGVGLAQTGQMIAPYHPTLGVACLARGGEWFLSTPTSGDARLLLHP